MACSTNLNPAVCVVGASLAGLAALIHANRHHLTATNPDSELPAAPFTSENISRRFTSALPTITRELNLEVATTKQIETFGFSKNLSILFGLIDPGTNIVPISMPVTCRFHVRLHDPWKLESACG
ncbi:MAG: hypothetical protein ACLQAH_09765 [Limisphaerales bacterium]